MLPVKAANHVLSSVQAHAFAVGAEMYFFYCFPAFGKCVHPYPARHGALTQCRLTGVKVLLFGQRDEVLRTWHFVKERGFDKLSHRARHLARLRDFDMLREVHLTSYISSHR